ncbi:ATP-dependent helicase [Lachnospiraceae bacterium ZAX-1]
MSFTKSQEEAIKHNKGPMLVLAGPGSGKTLVITHRVKNLIENFRVNPSGILVITFTKAAANEMKERFSNLMGERKYPVTFGTFHAIFFNILKHAYGYHAGNIVKEEQKNEYMRDIITTMGLEYEDEHEFMKLILGEISMVKNTMIPLQHYYSVNCAQEVFQSIFQKYEEKLKKNRLIDFDDMLVYCNELLEQRADILVAWQKKYKYVLIDEFQDINKIQFGIIKMLALPENNLFVVGDDDQSIYRFRGAKPEIMLGFNKSYQDAKQVLLNVNYRSQANIVNHALQLISHNEERFKKDIKAEKSAGSKVAFQLFENQSLEDKCIIESILSHKKRGGAYQDIAILFRTNTQPRLLMEQLLSYNIPFRTKDNIPNLYEHWIARDILTYIDIAMGSRSRKDFLRVMNRPKRYISRESLDESTIAFDVWVDYYHKIEQPWVAERIEQLEADIRVLSRITPYGAVNYIRKGIGYEGYLTKYADDRHINAEELFETLDELQEAAKAFKTYEEWLLHIEQYKEELVRQKQQQMNQKRADQQKEPVDSVALATLHSSKGLEYKIVHIIDVNEGLMPFRKAVLDADLQEERRMFYVGVTRAMEELHLSASKKINGKEMDVSRFIPELFGYKEEKKIGN